MNEFRLQLKLKDGQNLGYIQMRDNKPYYDYGYSEATLFDPVGVLNLLNRISLDKYDVYAEVPYTTNKGRKGTAALKNEELKTYMKNELGKAQVMENKNMNEKMIDKYGREVDPKEWEEKEAKGLNEKAEADEHEANELVLYMENTQRHYNNIMAVVKNLARKMARGNFDKELAVKGMMYPVNDGARAYKKEFSGEGYEKYAFSPATRELAARELLDRYMEDIENEAKAKSESKINEADEQFAPDAEGALADFLGTDVENVIAMDYDNYGIPMYEADGEEWAVTDDYDLVEEAAKEEVIQLIDELGVEALNWDNMGGIGEYLNMDWFDMAMEESNQFYIDDIREESASSDEYENRLAEEMAEAGVETEEDYLEVLNNNYDNGYEWYVTNIGQPDKEVIAEAGLDSEKAAEEVLATDGAGHLLSSYDGNMVEHDFEGTTFYMFRQN